MVWLWAGAGLLVMVTLVAIAQYRSANATYSPLSQSQPDRRSPDTPLGMEALDLEHVSRTNRTNESLERGQTNWLRGAGFFGRSDNDVLPLSDDETYAARYYDAFHKDKR